jgi:hypothetical protein
VQTSALRRGLHPLARRFTLEVARQLTALKVHPERQARLIGPVDKAAEGPVTPSDHDAYEVLAAAVGLVGIRPARARAVLKNSPAA